MICYAVSGYHPNAVAAAMQAEPLWEARPSRRSRPWLSSFARPWWQADSPPCAPPGRPRSTCATAPWPAPQPAP